MELNTRNDTFDVPAVARSAGSVGIPKILGFRSAPPQALRYRPLRGLNKADY